MDLTRVNGTNIKNINYFSNKSNSIKKELLSYAEENKQKVKKNKYLNINNQFSPIVKDFHKIENIKKFDDSIIKQKYHYPINKTKSNFILIKRNGAFQLIEVKSNNKIKTNINNKNEKRNQLKIIGKESEKNDKLNNEYGKKINDKLKYNIIEFGRNKKLNIHKYIENKNIKLKSNENKKTSLINGNNKQLLFIHMRQNQDTQELENFHKTENFDDTINKKLFEKDNKTKLLDNKIKFKISKRLNNNSIECFKLDKKIRHVPVKSLNYNNNHSEIKKTLQKYFSLIPRDLIGKNSSKENKDNKKENLYYNKINTNENESKNISLNDMQIKRINYKKNKRANHKVIKFKKKSIQINFDNNNLIKSSDLNGNYKNKLTFENEKNILNTNKNYLINNKIIHKKTISANPNYMNYKSLFLKHNSKSMSLNLVNNLDDYIGPNQYDNIIIPNHTRTINQRISSEKEKEKKEFNKLLNTEGIKTNNEHYNKLRNRTNKTPDDYFNKKDFDKLILSGDKKSKYYKMRNLLYESVFNNNKIGYIEKLNK